VLQVRKDTHAKAETGAVAVSEQELDIAAKLRVTIEEELGGFRRFAEVPSAEIEEMARRLVRSVAPILGIEDNESKNRAA
jgi:hypothetical protein